MDHDSSDPNDDARWDTAQDRLISRFIHCKRRAEERYGIELTWEIWYDILSQIKQGIARKAADGENGKEIYLVTVQSRQVPVVVQDGEICTFINWDGVYRILEAVTVRKMRENPRYGRKKNKYLRSHLRKAVEPAEA
jgi:hypothetical protein